MPSVTQRAADLLRRSAYTVALTGAGISTPSGIPDFRSPQSGLWVRVDPLEVASIWAFHARPAEFYRWIAPLLAMLRDARPNAAHRVLAEMEAQQRLQAIITQNIDSLHQAAGSRRVLELHGHIRSATCLACGTTLPAEPFWPRVLRAEPPLCPGCGGLLKPDVVLFGEPLPYETLSAAQHEALRCEVMLIAGTSLEVMPAADLPRLAQRRGAKLILVNRDATPIDDSADIVLHKDVTQGLTRLWRYAR
jgi:NAD-dependent deacetylase